MAFEKIKSGFARLKNEARPSSQENFLTWYASESKKLYDYLLRMSGEIDKSINVVKEVLNSIQDQEEYLDEDLKHLRKNIYATARSFSADCWNADTAQLENAAMVTGASKLEAADGFIRSLPGWKREPIVLVSKSDFDIGDAAEIMGSEKALLEEDIQQTLDAMSQNMQITLAEAKSLVRLIPLHPMPDHATHTTMALSQLIGDIDDVELSFWQKNKVNGLWVACGIFILLMIFWMFS